MSYNDVLLIMNDELCFYFFVFTFDFKIFRNADENSDFTQRKIADWKK